MAKPKTTLLLKKKPQRLQSRLPEALLILGSLNQGELATVKEAVEKLLVEGPPGKGGPTKEEQLLFFALCDELPASGGFRPTLQGLLKTRYAKSWRKASQVVFGFMPHFGPINQQNLTYGLYRLLWGLLAVNLRAIKVPVTASVMIGQAERIPSIFEQNFPGYLESGLVPMIPNLMLKGKVKKWTS